jgi:hypothetical protein
VTADEVGVAATNVPGVLVLYERDGCTVTLHTVQMDTPVAEPLAVFSPPAAEGSRRER